MSILFIVFIAAIYLTFTRRSLADIEFLILHNNDLHARIEGNINMYGGRYGGFGRIAHVVKEARRAARYKGGPPVLYLYAGDTYRQPVWRTRFGSNLGIEFLNLLRPDVACFGEHDLDRPFDDLYHFVKKINFPLIVANLHFDDDPYLTYKLKPSVVVHIDADIVVGVIGYVSSANSYLLPANSSIRYEDEVEAVRRESVRLKKEGVDVIVALGYAGLAVDKRIAADVEDVDVVIGGLTNSMLWNGPAPKEDHDDEKGRQVEGPYPTVVVQKESGKRVPVAQTYGFAKYVGRLRLSYEEASSTMGVQYEGQTAVTIVEGDPIFLSSDIPNDEEILTALARYEPKLRTVQQSDTVLGQSIIPLTAEDAHYSESNLANFVTDAILNFAIAKGYATSSSFVLLHAGAFRGQLSTSKDRPNITKTMMEEVISCYHKLIYIHIKGNYIKQALEDGVSRSDRNSFLHSGGLRIDIDMGSSKNDRVKSVRTMCMAGEEPRYCQLGHSKDYRFLSVAFFLTQSGHDVLRYEGSMTTLSDELMDAIVYAFNTFGTTFRELDNRIFQYRRSETLKSERSSSPSITIFRTASSFFYSRLIYLYLYFSFTLTR